MKNFHLFGKLAKMEAQDDGTLIVKGIVSSESVDSEGEIVTAAAMREAIPDYMQFGAVREMHGASAAGTAISINVGDDDITRFEALIVDPLAIKKCETGVYKGFSIGGKKTQRDELNKRKITGVKLTEISLVDRPANPDAVFELAKADATGRFQKPDNATTVAKGGAMGADTLKKGLWDVQSFAGLLCSLGWLAQDAASEALWEGDSSPVPASLKKNLTDLAETFKAMAAEEVEELITSIRVSSPDVLALAKKTEDLQKQYGALKTEHETLEKKGAAFSKDAKAKMATAHDHIKKADAAMSDTGYDKDADSGDKETTEKLAKFDATVKEREEALAKADAAIKENEDLKKQLTEQDEQLTAANDTLKDVMAKLDSAAPAANGSGVALNKKADGAPSPTDDTLNKAEDTPKAAVLRAIQNGTPVYR